MPTSVVLNYKEGVWLVNPDKTEELAEKNVLTWMVSAIYFHSSISEVVTFLSKLSRGPISVLIKYPDFSYHCNRQSQSSS